MSDEIEFRDEKALMAYVGEVPWHRYGTQCPPDLTPMQFMEKAGLDTTVEKVPIITTINGSPYTSEHSVLLRSDKKILGEVSNDWNVIQNEEAFDFFNEFVATNDMSMECAGSLKEGTIVWALAKINEKFELFGGDIVEGYLNFTNYFKYGYSTDIRATNVRVVCNNTLNLALSTKSDHMVRVSHRMVFDADEVKAQLGVAKHKLQQYKEMAQFLGSKQAKGEDTLEYFKRVFPRTPSKKTADEQVEEMSRNAKAAVGVLHTQPGHQYAEGTWWQNFNASTFVVDHLSQKDGEKRFASSFYGNGRTAKLRALEVAVEMANVA